jgi:hypothetical protein
VAGWVSKVKQFIVNASPDASLLVFLLIQTIIIDAILLATRPPAGFHHVSVARNISISSVPVSPAPLRFTRTRVKERRTAHPDRHWTEM